MNNKKPLENTQQSGPLAQEKFQAAWAAATTSEDRVTAVYQYAVNLRREQAEQGGNVEAAEEIADRVAFEQHLSREEWGALDALLEHNGFIENAAERDFQAAWSAAMNSSDRVEAVFQFAEKAQDAPAYRGASVQEIASRTALERNLSREEWAALDERLREAGYAAEQQEAALEAQAQEAAYEWELEM